MKINSFIVAALASVVTAQDACKLYNYYSSNGYEILNNLWGEGSATSGAQCTYVDSVTDAGTKWHSNWTWVGAPNNVKSYVYAGRLFTKKPVSQFTNLQTEANWAYDTTNIRCNVAYDLFTAQDVNHTTSSGDYELMIWLARYDVYPIGSSQGMVTIGGRTWELFYGLNGAMKVYSFVAPSPIPNFTADVKDFFAYLTENKDYPASTQNLITYQFGSEAFTGGPATFSVNKWSATAS
ncbi:glycoside hydrolase family 12 protein [Bipolaris maydis ATCC 48331]|uniref:Glycoside hydrolase family 12 protein n=2 Tax=Cochliobolus heterostrophus TaxID=5016 RepID=M2VA90_COCH5|nr:glycoside hydrolase family 12 protein [Bipolaris maydis ATCC 48331]EMD96857.1 glycoside hydrolase family 12 protein [Bipolaris maydis C5]KAJ5031265.1 glycoside hydrolase [Bipolaris maydis]ENI03726.1 glycoside hydrolase family 12 protein [Bipolaris maydis ATCC 48331]KAJ5052965.1 concanavalin A-like lectin/glucanase domain-containing protein [Bipolaris maydis]KAJ6201492.1 concanavalin A-like lectin/glucanase domain-containing protein [Bipolaris maydis]